jgi:hypothetical protein
MGVEYKATKWRCSLTVIRNRALKRGIKFDMNICYECFQVRCVLCIFVLTKIKLKKEIFFGVNLVVKRVVPVLQRHNIPSNCHELLTH